MVSGYVEQVDRLLAAACALFPADEPTPAPAMTAQWVQGQQSPPHGFSALASGAARAADEYGRAASRVVEATEATERVLATAAAQAGEAAATAVSIRDSARGQADAIMPAAQAPDGVDMLVSTMEERLAAMQQLVASTREQMRMAAEQLHRHAGQLGAVCPDAG